MFTAFHFTKLDSSNRSKVLVNLQQDLYTEEKKNYTVVLVIPLLIGTSAYPFNIS